MDKASFAQLGSPLSHKEAGERIRRMGEILTDWYQTAARDLPWRRSRNPYHIWLSEVMLQQTRVDTVIPYYERFLAALPDIPALAGADEELLHKLWEGLGYYSRVRNLQKAARQMTDQYGGQLPPSYDALLNLCGIGEYTAGAVASIAFGEAVPAVDGNVLRVMSRLLAAEGDILSPRVKKGFGGLLREEMPQDRPGDFNQAMMDLGATICLPNRAPRCEDCPVNALCLGAERGQQSAFPVKAPKARRQVQERTVLLILDEGGRILLRKRPSEGLLAGLWEFPNLEGRLSREEVAAFLQARGIAPVKLQTLREAKHIFTHLEWRMTGFLIRCGQVTLKEGEALASNQERRERFPLPSAFDAYGKILDGMGKDEAL